MNANLKTCVSCQNRQRQCQGPCACTVDGRDIKDHAKSGECPDGRFPTGNEPKPVDPREALNPAAAFACKGCGQ